MCGLLHLLPILQETFRPGGTTHAHRRNSGSGPSGMPGMAAYGDQRPRIICCIRVEDGSGGLSDAYASAILPATIDRS